MSIFIRLLNFVTMLLLLSHFIDLCNIKYSNVCLYHFVLKSLIFHFLTFLLWVHSHHRSIFAKYIHFEKMVIIKVKALINLLLQKRHFLVKWLKLKQKQKNVPKCFNKKANRFGTIIGFHSNVVCTSNRLVH